MTFLFNWLIYYVMIMFAMSVDNLFWISTSGEWSGRTTVRRGKRTWKGPVKKYSLLSKIEYAWNYRVLSVITHWRDIVPGIITSFIMVVVL